LLFPAFWIDPKNRFDLLSAVVHLLAGNAFIQLEGNLDDCDFSKVHSTADPIVPVPRQTDPIEGDIIVLPLKPETSSLILEQVHIDHRYKKAIAAIQIIKNSKIEFIAGDHFDRECISVGENVPESFLVELKKKGIIKSFKKG
jgi:hypothetical protein